MICLTNALFAISIRLALKNVGLTFENTQLTNIMYGLM